MVQTPFFHGARVDRLPTGLRPVNSNDFATIGLIGTAPKGEVNTPVQVLNREQGVELFGEDTEGYTIPLALDGIFDQIGIFGGVKVIVVNVLEPSVENNDPTVDLFEPDSLVWTGETLALNVEIVSITIYNDDLGSGLDLLTEGVDYTVDYPNGIVTRIPAGQITDNANISYDATVRRFQDDKDFVNDQIQLPSGLTFLRVRDSVLNTTYSEGTDYTVDTATGLITRLTSGSIPTTRPAEITYSATGSLGGDPSAIGDSEIIGAITTEGNRTGLKAFELSYTKFGYFPRILIAPDFSESNNVVAEMQILVNAIDAMMVIDAPENTSSNAVITGRGADGNINFNYGDPRIVGCYPRDKVFRPLTNQVELMPMSIRFAGAWANSIVERGFWYSPSNIPVRGVIGKEIDLTYIPGRADTEINNLNANGILTTINDFGDGFKLWGNRSFAYPASTDPLNFIAVQFSDIVVTNTLRDLAQQYVDRPINDALIDLILDNGNAYIENLVNFGALIAGSRVYYNPQNNPAIDLADGKLKIEFEVMYPPPAEQIIIRRQININLLENLNEGRTLTNTGV